MAAELKESHGVEAELIAGGGGVFEIKADGQLIYAKAETGRFPKPGEAASLLQRQA